MVFNLYSKELKLLQVTSNYISTNFHRTENVHKWDECKSLLIYFISKKHVYVYVKKISNLYFYFVIHNALNIHQRLLPLMLTKYLPLYKKKIQSKEEALVTFFRNWRKYLALV